MLSYIFMLLTIVLFLQLEESLQHFLPDKSSGNTLPNLLFCWESFSPLHFWKTRLWKILFLIGFFLFYFFLFWLYHPTPTDLQDFCRKICCSLLGVHLNNKPPFSMLSNFHFVFIFNNLTMVRLGWVGLCGFILFDVLQASWMWISIYFPKAEKFSAIISLNIFTIFFSFFFLSYE